MILKYELVASVHFCCFRLERKKSKHSDCLREKLSIFAVYETTKLITEWHRGITLLKKCNFAEIVTCTLVLNILIDTELFRLCIHNLFSHCFTR